MCWIKYAPVNLDSAQQSPAACAALAEAANKEKGVPNATLTVEMQTCGAPVQLKRGMRAAHG